MANPLESFKNLGTGGKIAVVGGGLVSVYLVYRYKKNQSASSATSASAIDPVTGLPTSEDNTVDPLTGQTYLAEAQEYGSVAAAEQAVSAESSSLANEGSAAETSSYGYSPGTGSTVSGTGYASNAAWSQAVTAGLGDLGYSSSDVASALGLYLGGLPLNTLADGTSAVSIVQAALAEYGPPPTPPAAGIIMPTGTTTAAAGSTSTTTTPTTTSTPPAAAAAAAPAVIKTAPTGFRVVSVTGGDNVNLAWNAIPAATGYVIAYGPTSGSQEYKQGVGGGATSEATVPGVGAGSAGKHYFELWATPAAPGGPHAGPIEATTTKS
jgi:hypothetical protein